LLALAATLTFADLKVGDTAPELALEKVVSPAGAQPPSLKSLRGKVVYLEFWGTWCGHCIMALPHLNALQSKFAAKGVEFISITEEREALVSSFLKKTSIAGTVALDTDSSVFGAYSANALPLSVIIDKAGKIVALTHPDYVTEETLEDALAGRALRLNKDTEAKTQPIPDNPPLVQIKVAVSKKTQGMAGVGPDDIYGVAIRPIDVISFTYGMPKSRIILDTPLPDLTYDITGKGPGSAKMLGQAFQNALGISIEKTQRPVTAYVMVPIEGAANKLEKPEANQKPSAGLKGDSCGATNYSISLLASFLDGKAGVPVVDETGLAEKYNYQMECEKTDFESLRAALRAQVGLDLRKETRTMEVLVVRKAG
jgi:uncharacterized protein (TIGR03435 family)